MSTRVRRALVDDAEVRQFLKDAAAGGVALVQRRFRDGITAGEIPSDFPVAVRAIQVTDFARGLTMRAQFGTPRKTLLRDAEEAADWCSCRARNLLASRSYRYLSSVLEPGSQIGELPMPPSRSDRTPVEPFRGFCSELRALKRFVEMKLRRQYVGRGSWAHRRPLSPSSA